MRLWRAERTGFGYITEFVKIGTGGDENQVSYFIWPNGDILRKVFWRISALVFEHYYNIIKGRLYANHLSGVKASLYDTEQTQGRVYAPRSRPFLAGLSMRKVSYRVA